MKSSVPEPDLASLFRGRRAQREEWARRHLGVRLGRAVGHEPSQQERLYDADLLDRAQAGVRRILTQLAAERVDVGALTAPLIVMPPGKRWQIITTQPQLWVLPAVTALFDGAELLLDRGADEVEELVLAALHLTDRLPVARYSRAMLMDLYARAWLLRLEVALMRHQRDAAEFALSFVHHFQVEGTGDPRILLATARASAWLAWSEGDLSLAAEMLRVTAHRASQAQDPRTNRRGLAVVRHGARTTRRPARRRQGTGAGDGPAGRRTCPRARGAIAAGGGAVGAGGEESLTHRRIQAKCLGLAIELR